jgi:hypothetical protein
MTKGMVGGVKGRWSARRTSEMNGRDAHGLKGGIEADRGHVSTGVGKVWKMRRVIHDRRVAVAHSHVRAVAEGLVERSGNIDGGGWLRDLVGSWGE